MDNLFVGSRRSGLALGQGTQEATTTNPCEFSRKDNDIREKDYDMAETDAIFRCCRLETPHPGPCTHLLTSVGTNPAESFYMLQIKNKNIGGDGLAAIHRCGPPSKLDHGKHYQRKEKKRLMIRLGVMSLFQ